MSPVLTKLELRKICAFARSSFLASSLIKILVMLGSTVFDLY